MTQDSQRISRRCIFSGLMPLVQQTFVTGWLNFNSRQGHAAGCTSIDAETRSKETLYRPITPIVSPKVEPEEG